MFEGFLKLKHLNLEKNVIQTLPQEIFSDTPNLVCLILKNNKVENISMFAFSGLVNLVTLDLSFNKLNVLKRNIFGSLQSLKKLILVHNKISKIEKGGLIGLSCLEWMFYDGNIKAKATFQPTLQGRLYLLDERQKNSLTKIEQ